MHHKGYDVWVTCDGEQLPEYQTKVEGDQGKNVACYIPSESGKNFVIHWRDGVGRDWLTLTFKLDGSTLGHSSLCVAGQSGKRAGVLTSADIEQPFEFANLHTTDDDSLLTGLSNNNELGTIEVSVRRVRSEYTLVPYYPGGFNPVGSVHERSKKAGAHSVSLGKGTKISGQPCQYLERHAAVDPLEGYVAVFVFRYRPRALLQAQGIIPSSPSASYSQAGSSQAVKKEKKRVNSSADGPAAKRPKVEPGAEKVDLGVIDISDDDENLDVLQVSHAIHVCLRTMTE
ncbi:hypothetical protein C8Q76DRAFT_616324 [Earliella scabrosa]|nr:hypothetical protein C8Q76DRAFT_616324 [Earliella scabrosa]